MAALGLRAVLMGAPSHNVGCYAWVNCPEVGDGLVVEAIVGSELSGGAAARTRRGVRGGEVDGGRGVGRGVEGGEGRGGRWCRKRSL